MLLDNMKLDPFHGCVRLRLLIVVNVDWFFCSHRLPVALEAKRCGFEVHVATTFTDEVCRELLVSHGLHVHELSIDRSARSATKIIVNFFCIYRLFRKLRPDLVHLVTIQPVLFGGLAARCAGVERVVYAISGLGHAFLHDSIFSKFRRFCVGILYQSALGVRRKIVIYQNEDDKNIISSFCDIPAEQIRIIPGSGVNLSKFVPTPIPRGAPVIQMASRLLATKGVREFVDAAVILSSRGVRATFHLIGEPDIFNPAAISMSEIDEWKRLGFVKVLGLRNDMHLLMQEAHIVCLPSYREGLPKVLCEAAASGRPVVTSNVPGCRDSIQNGVTGLLVPPRDPIALADALEYLLTNPDIIKSMGSEARKRAERLFDSKDIVDQHMWLYRSLLAVD
jgi:glycosyltransferase involved in cell wall biosynthesis